jgi:outer membrane cobalamin receptor
MISITSLSYQTIEIMKQINFNRLIVGIFLISNILSATEVKWQITGKIIEDKTQAAIPYATVAIYNKIDSSVVTGTISDDNGQFTLERVSLGDYYLKISFMGYQDYILNHLNLTENSKIVDLGTITLTPSLEQLEEVQVKARVASIRNTVDKQILNVGSNLSAIGGTAIDALKLSPSIQTDSDGNVKLRGSANFIVLINGKPTTLTPTEVLKQTPANSISKIEVITNPSVKYSAEGGAGIINIILKKGIESGLNGIVNASIGSRSKYSGDANFNLNKKKISYSLGFDWRDFTKVAYNNYYRTLYNEDNTHYAQMLQDRRITESNLGFRFGLDYNPDEKNNYTYSFHTGYNEVDGRILNTNSGYTIPASTEEHKFNPFYFKMKPVFFTNNLGYTRTLNEGENLAFNLYYSYIDYDFNNQQASYITDENQVVIDTEPYRLNVLNKNNSNDVRFDIDYTNTLKENTTLETGLSFHQYNRFLDITYAEYDYNVNDFVNNTDYTNKYNFDEAVYATYLNLNSSFLSLNTSFGLRIEYTDRLLKRKNSNEKYAFDRVNYFPGFSISKNLNDNNSLKLAMTNRINRPDEYMMNPFPEFQDDYFYAEGNPYLIPEIVRNIEVGYNYSKNKTSFSSNLYYRQTTDKLEQKLTVREDDKIGTIFHNDAADKAVGLELMGNFQINDWWSVNANTNLFHYDIWAIVEDIKTSRSNFTWSSQLVNSINISESTSLQLIGYYNSKTVRSQGELSSFYFLDIALKQQFMNDRLSISLQCKDILQSLNYQLTTETGNMDLLGDFNNESPIVLFNISYKLSNYKKKTKDVQTEFDM